MFHESGVDHSHLYCFQPTLKLATWSVRIQNPLTLQLFPHTAACLKGNPMHGNNGSFFHHKSFLYCNFIHRDASIPLRKASTKSAGSLTISRADRKTKEGNTCNGYYNPSFSIRSKIFLICSSGGICLNFEILKVSGISSPVAYTDNRRTQDSA